MANGYEIESRGSVKRYCMTLDLKDNEELIEQYKYYHSTGAWPEIMEGIASVGIYDMEIYLVKNRMFMILEVPLDFDYEKMMGKLATLDRQQEWEEFMWRFQQKLPWITDDTKWAEMERVFSFRDITSR